jgi:hypothetical protein
MSLFEQQTGSSGVKLTAGSAAVNSVGLRFDNSCLDPFLENVTLQFGNSSDEDEHRLAHRAVGVDLLPN